MDSFSAELVGTVAGTLTTVSFLPQAYKVYTTGDTKAISLFMFLIFVSGVAMWIFYGILIHQLPVVIPNVITFILALFILIMKIKNG